MKKKGGPDNEYSMCVLGIRKPTCKEAEEFFRADIITILYGKRRNNASLREIEREHYGQKSKRKRM